MPIDPKPRKVTMRTPTPTTVDQITAEKMKISERLARLDADREKIAAQLADLETAERVLTRVSKTPPGRRPRSPPAAEATAAITPRGRGRPPTSQLPNHGLWPGLRLLPQSFLT